MLKEVAELWENVLYLWAALAMLNKKVYTDVHVEVVYLNGEDYKDFTAMKYDDFENFYPEWSDICYRMEYLKQQYTESNLAIIVVERIDNYFHNYYGAEHYRGILFYDRNNPNIANNGFRILQFGEIDGTKKIEYSPTGLYGDEMGPFMIAAKNINTLTPTYYAPFSGVPAGEELKYFGVIRSLIRGCDVEYDTVEKCLKIKKDFSVALKDALGCSLQINDTPIQTDDIGTYSLITSEIYIGDSDTPIDFPSTQEYIYINTED